MATGKASVKVVDFSNVKEVGNFNTKRVPSGDYLAKVVKVEDSKTKEGGEFQYLFTIKLQSFSQYSYPYYCKLQENQLWKLRNLMLAGGINIPKKRTQLDPNRVVGKLIGVTMEDDEYDGKEKSVIQAVFPASELPDGDQADEGDTGDDEEYEEPADDEEDVDLEDEAEDEAEEDESDDFDGMDRTELKAWLKAQDPAFAARKSQTDDDLRDLARSMNAAGDDEEEEEDEVEEEPEPPKPAARKAAAKPAAKKTAAKRAAPVDDDELEELDVDDL